MPALVPTLQVLAVTHDVSPLLRYLLPHLVQNLFDSSSGETWAVRIQNRSSDQSSPVALCHR